MDILTAVQAKGIVLDKVSATRGGEWAGQCLKCCGEDRFRCWPKKDHSWKEFFFSQCNQKGADLIEFFRWADGMGYKEACETAGCEAKQHTYCKPVMPAQPHRPAFVPSSHADPDALWEEKVAKFVDQHHEQLLGNQAVLQWLLEKRDINFETVKKFCLDINADKKFFRTRESWGLTNKINTGTGKKKKQWIPGGLLVLCIYDGGLLRIRIRRRKEDLRSDIDPCYYFVPGSYATMMIIGIGHRACKVIETELDNMLVHQESGGLVQVITMGTTTPKPDTICASHLEAAEILLIFICYDQVGAKGSEWWTESTYPQALIWRPACGKNSGDMHQYVDMRAWVLSGLPPLYPIGSLVLHNIIEGGRCHLESAAQTIAGQSTMVRKTILTSRMNFPAPCAVSEICSAITLCGSSSYLIAPPTKPQNIFNRNRVPAYPRAAFYGRRLRTIPESAHG